MSNNNYMFLRMIHEEFEAIATTLIKHYFQSTNHNSISHRRGFVMNHRVINRNRVEGHERLYYDYFADSPIYPPQLFRRRFRMRRSLFIRIQVVIESHDQYFVQRFDAVGVPGLSSLQKIIAAIRMLAYGSPADALYEYVRIGKSTTIESLKRFVKAAVEVFGKQYLRRPNSTDIARLMTVAEQRGFPGMLGSIDCIHWKWRNCPAAWHGMYTGSLNDINMLDRSHAFLELAEGRGPEVRYTVNGHEYTIGYYLANGIYPSWPTFVKTIPSPQGNKNKYFAAQQESARKDIERAFGVVQSQFAIIRRPSRFWDVETLKSIMMACIILHNMIVEDERDTSREDLDFNYDTVIGTPIIDLFHIRTNEVIEFIQVHQ